MLTDLEIGWLRVNEYWGAAATAYFLAFQGFADPSNLVRACARWRDAKQSELAVGKIEHFESHTTADFASIVDRRLRSALLTTFAGALRDLGRIELAFQRGLVAASLDSANYRPCNLLGAACYDLGRYAEAVDYFAEAERLGAPPRSSDAEHRRALMEAKSDDRIFLARLLLKRDPDRFDWVRKYVND